MNAPSRTWPAEVEHVQNYADARPRSSNIIAKALAKRSTN